jgi:hypothetical protein
VIAKVEAARKKRGVHLGWWQTPNKFLASSGRDFVLREPPRATRRPDC